MLVGTGTGATGWCASLAAGMALRPTLPAPEEPALCWFVREARPSPTTGTSLVAGRISDDGRLELTVASDRLVVFSDGGEADRLVATRGAAGAGRPRTAAAATGRRASVGPGRRGNELGGAVVQPAEDTPFGRLAGLADPTGAFIKIAAASAIHATASASCAVRGDGRVPPVNSANALSSARNAVDR